MRSIRKLRDRRLAEIERDIGIISNFKRAYSSQRSVQQRRIAKIRQKEFLEGSSVQNHQGQKFSLAELAEKTVSNPAIRRAELMTRISGFEHVALASGHSCFFHTLTTPSRMHRKLSKSGRNNPKFDGTTPREAQNYLRMVWARTRAALARADIKPYGFRISEPHHDGTPHWHFMLFISADKSSEMNRIMQDYALMEDGAEKGALKYRFKSIEIDMNKGSAAGYIAKYISKSIDGEHLDEDLLGNDAKNAAERIEAWARNHGIRQFQQIGGPSVTVWRELRRCREPLENQKAEDARQAADSGNWAAFTFAMGGIGTPRSNAEITPLYEHLKTVDIHSGEILVNLKNKYGEEKQPSVRGVVIDSTPISTRRFAWSTDRFLIPFSSLEKFSSSAKHESNFTAQPGGTWTRVNNCTQIEGASIH